MVAAPERGHLKHDLLGSVIVRRAEHHIQCDFSCTARFPTGDYSSKGCAASLDAVPVYFHFSKGFLINEVQSAASIHEHLGEAKAVHYGTEDQCGWCSGCSEFRFVTGIEGNSRVTPWIYCCYLVDFGKAAERSLPCIVLCEGLEDC